MPSLSEAEAVATRMLQKLPVTPVSAIGINFAFEQETIPLEIANLFRIGDTGKISDVPLAIKSTTITRQLEFDGRDLNLRLGQNADGKLSVHFNYHIAVPTTATAEAALANKVVAYYWHSRELLATLYNLEIDGEEDAQ